MPSLPSAMAKRWTSYLCVLGMTLPYGAAALAQSAPAPAPAAMPPPAPPPAPPAPMPPPMPYWQRPPWGPLATVTLKSDPEGLAFHRVAGLIVEGWRHHTRVGRVYQPLCAAPCTLGLPPGVTELALSTPGGVPVRTAPVTIPSGSSEIYGYFESRLGFRIAGWTITAASLIGGITLMTLAFHDHETCYGYYGCEHIHTVNTGEFVAGMLVLGIGTPIGIFMAGMRDIPHIEVRGL